MRWPFRRFRQYKITLQNGPYTCYGQALCRFDHYVAIRKADSGILLGAVGHTREYAVRNWERYYAQRGPR